MNLEFLIKIFRKPISLARLKIALFPVLIAGVSIDYFISYDIQNHKILFSAGGESLIIPIAILLIFILLIVVDIWDRKKVLKERKEKLELLSNPDVPAEIKIEIAKQLDL